MRLFVIKGKTGAVAREFSMAYFNDGWEKNLRINLRTTLQIAEKVYGARTFLCEIHIYVSKSWTLFWKIYTFKTTFFLKLQIIN